jgi:hypothetical protein
MTNMLITFFLGFVLGSYNQHRRAKKKAESECAPPTHLVPLSLEPDKWTRAEWLEFKNRPFREERDPP